MRTRAITLGAVSIGVLVCWGMASMALYLYNRGRTILDEEVRSSLRTTAAVGALQFSARDLALFHTHEDAKRPAYRGVVAQLQAIKSAMPTLRYAYIMRRTKDPAMLEFVADADSLLGFEEADLNHNGTLEADEELSLPGDLYDVQDNPVLQGTVWNAPAVDTEWYSDQWGTWLSGYAPIRDAAGNTVAILGIDMSAAVYEHQVQRLFSALSVVATIAVVMLFATIIALSIWRQQIAVLEEVDHERSALVSLAFHQLGTPLSILRWWIDILRGQAANNAELLHTCTQFEDATARIGNVYGALKDADALSLSSKEHIALEQTSLTALLAPVVERMTKRLQTRGQTLVTDIRNAPLLMDAQRIRQLVEELVENASTFSPKDAQVTLTAQPRHRMVEISITDKGIGIPSDELGNIGTKFYRATNASSVKPDGNGMGLSIAREIAVQRGGKLKISSEQGKGTIVTLVLPAKPQAKHWWRFW